MYFSESGTVNIMGGNVTVTQDEQVEFQCVSSKWFPIPTVSWTWNSEAVNSSLYNTTSMADGDFFNCTSVLKFQAVRDTQIECWATMETLASPQSSSVYLVVGKIRHTLLQKSPLSAVLKLDKSNGFVA